MKDVYFGRLISAVLFLISALGMSPDQAQAQKFEFTTDKAIGEKVTIKIGGGGSAMVTGLKDVFLLEGDWAAHEYELTANTVKIEYQSSNDVPNVIDVANNRITDLSFKFWGMACPNIYCDRNKIPAAKMDAFIKGLPYKSGTKLFVIADYEGANEQNVCLKSTIDAVQDRGYNILKRTSATDESGTTYAGSEAATSGEYVKITTRSDPEGLVSFRLMGDGAPDQIKPGTKVDVFLDATSYETMKPYALKSLKAGDKVLETTEVYGTVKGSFIAEGDTEIVATYYKPKSKITVSVTPPDAGRLKVEVDGVEATGDALLQIEKGKSIRLTCLPNEGYSIDKLLVDGRDTYTSDSYPTSDFSMEGKDMKCELSLLAPVTIKVEVPENVESWSVSAYDKDAYGYKVADKSILDKLKANTKILFNFTVKEGYKIDKVVAANGTTEEEIVYSKSSWDPNDSGYKLVAKENVTIKVLVSEIKYYGITIDTPEGSPKIAVYENSSTGYYWQSKEITDLSRIQGGTKVRIEVPAATEAGMIDTYTIDNKPLSSFSQLYDNGVQKYCVEYDVNAPVVVKATFVLPNKIQVTQKTGNDNNCATITIYDKVNKTNLKNLVRPNGEVEIQVEPYYDYKVLRISALNKEGKEVILPIKEGRRTNDYGYEESYSYADYKVTEADNQIYVYVFSKDVAMHSIRVEGIDAEAAAAGAKVEISTEPFEEAKYPKGVSVKAFVTCPEGYTFSSLTANEGIELIPMEKSPLEFALVVKSDVVLTATFVKEVKKYTVTVADIEAGAKAAGCAVALTPESDADGKYAEGTVVTATITPATGYKFVELKATAGATLTKKSDLVYTFEVHGDVVLTATFAKEIKKYTVTIADIEAGAKAAGCAVALTPESDADGKYAEGTHMTITVTMGKGYLLDGVVVSDGSNLTERTEKVFTFDLKGDVTITATFKKDTAVESLEASSVVLYPNPAADYVNLDGAEAFALVQLFALDGVEVKRTTTDATGRAQLSLEGVVAGEYLVKSGSVVYRLLVQK